MATEAPSDAVSGDDLKARRQEARLPRWAVAVGMRTSTRHVATLEELGSGRPARRMVERYLEAIEVVMAARDRNDDP